SVQWWRTNLSSSSNVPSSNRISMRSRAVSLPDLCSRSRRSGPPPASASALRRRNSSRRFSCGLDGAAEGFCSGMRVSGRRWFLQMENGDGKMGGHPHGSQQQDNAKDQLRGDRERTLHRRLDGGDLQGGAHQRKHRSKRQRDNQDRSQDGSEDLLHEKLLARR